MQFRFKDFLGWKLEIDCRLHAWAYRGLISKANANEGGEGRKKGFIRVYISRAGVRLNRIQNDAIHHPSSIKLHPNLTLSLSLSIFILAWLIWCARNFNKSLFRYWNPLRRLIEMPSYLSRLHTDERISCIQCHNHSFMCWSAFISCRKCELRWQERLQKKLETGASFWVIKINLNKPENVH
jgi:hypothetical protein